jgi:hypothetical protein
VAVDQLRQRLKSNCVSSLIHRQRHDHYDPADLVGHRDRHPQADQPKAEKEPPGFWHRDTLTGDWGGLRSALADQGIAIPATYTAEVFSNVQGGMKRGSSYDGAFLPQIDVDLDKLMGWQGGSFRASMIQGHGPSMSQG